MSLQSRLEALVSAIGADVKALKLSAPDGYNPPVGQYTISKHILSAANGTAATGRFSTTPMDIGGNGITVDALAVMVNTALAGGTTVTRIALYKDNGTGGYPDFINAGSLLESGAIVLTAPSNAQKLYTFTPRFLAPGRYWVAFFYYASVAPTTIPILLCITNAVSLWSSGNATITRSLVKTGLTAFPVQGTDPVLVTNTDSLTPVIHLRRSA